MIFPHLELNKLTRTIKMANEKYTMQRLIVVNLALFFCALLPFAASADLAEGLAAFRNKDYATALRELKPLAQEGNARAQFTLGVMFTTGNGVQQDHREAATWYRRAAEQGGARAQFAIGMMYKNGQGVTQDYREAAKWLLQAALQGIAEAQFAMADSYDNGQGVHKDHMEAIKWYRQAAEQGNAHAQLRLGVLHAIGRNAPQDEREAVKWFRLAAEQGNAHAQDNLGRMYYNGAGVVANKVVAYALYNLSAFNDPLNKHKAAENRTSLAREMTRSQIEAGQDLTREMVKPGNVLRALAGR